MKIIAKLPNDKALVELDLIELANILGHYSKYDIEVDKHINKEVNISPIYTKHSLINSLQNESEYSKARTKLKSMLEALTPIENLIETLNKL